MKMFIFKGKQHQQDGDEDLPFFEHDKGNGEEEVAEQAVNSTGHSHLSEEGITLKAEAFTRSILGCFIKVKAGANAKLYHCVDKLEMRVHENGMQGA